MKATLLLALVLCACSGADLGPIDDPQVNPDNSDSGNSIDATKDTRTDGWSPSDGFMPVIQRCPHLNEQCAVSLYVMCDICAYHERVYVCDENAWHDAMLSPAPELCNEWCMPVMCP